MNYLTELPRRFGHQAEMTEQEQTSTNPVPAGLEPERESEKTEKIMPTEKGVEQYFPKQE